MNISGGRTASLRLVCVLAEISGKQGATKLQDPRLSDENSGTQQQQDTAHLGLAS